MNVFQRHELHNSMTSSRICIQLFFKKGKIDPCMCPPLIAYPHSFQPFFQIENVRVFKMRPLRILRRVVAVPLFEGRSLLFKTTSILIFSQSHMDPHDHSLFIHFLRSSGFRIGGGV